MSISIIIVFFIVMIIIFWIWLSVVLYSLTNGISPMPTSEKVKRKVLASIPPQTHGTIVDLGSGWGTMAIQLAKKLPHCQVIGYETSLVPYYFSKIWHYFDNVHNLKIIRSDFFDIPLNQTSLVYTYLYPGAMKKLREKFEKELQPGTIIISNTFSVPGWDPVQILEVKDMYNTRIYMYVNSNSNADDIHRPDDADVENFDEILMRKR